MIYKKEDSINEKIKKQAEWEIKYYSEKVEEHEIKIAINRLALAKLNEKIVKFNSVNQPLDPLKEEDRDFYLN